MKYSDPLKIHKIVLLAVMLAIISPLVTAQEQIGVGSKLFTESVILGEMATQLLESDGFEIKYTDQLGGSRILWSALNEEEIDIYPDYTGTLIQEILRRPEIRNVSELNDTLQGFGVQVTQPLGFNNTYAMGMLKEKAVELEIEKISDLQNHPDLKFGFSNEFLDRIDGWKGLRDTYRLPQNEVTGLDHDLAYRGLEAGNIDVIDLYSTDAEIDYYDLAVLEDDLDYFPAYEAVFVYRTDLKSTAVTLLKTLENTITDEEMVAMNAAVKLEGRSDKAVAAEFLNNEFQVESVTQRETLWSRLWKTTKGHLYLVGISLGLAILISIPLGVMAVKFPVLEQSILGVVGILQTIPSLALLVFMIPLLGIGAVPAMAALFLYSLLPVVRNTHSGIKNIEPSVMESARALGLPGRTILSKIELPLALPTILAGIKTSAVINVGTATLGALIGAGGYGQPILTGIRLDSVPLILEGAVPAALLALAVQGIFDLIEWVYVKH